MRPVDNYKANHIEVLANMPGKTNTTPKMRAEENRRINLSLKDTLHTMLI